MNTQSATVTEEYQSLEDLGFTGISTGNIRVQNISAASVLITTQEEAPEADTAGFILRSYESMIFSAADGTIYLKAFGGGGSPSACVVIG
jgi:hypothetical protein